MKKIIWRKWKDPLYPLVDNWEPDYESVSEGNVGLYYPQKEGIWNGPVLVGPQGSIPLTESNLPGVLFNFWRGDTNFTITPAIRNAISKVEGVESLDIFTRYRFRLGIGQAFDENVVKRNIQRMIEPPEPEVYVAKKGSNAVKDILSKKYNAWAIVKLSNNKVCYLYGDKQEEVEEQLKKYTGNERFVLSWEQ